MRRAGAGRAQGRARRDAGAAGPEAGFALLAALLGLLALSALSTAGYLVAGSEWRISGNHRATVEARELARAGISEYLAADGRPAARAVYVHGRDTARVTAGRLLYLDPDGRAAILRLTARGIVARPGPIPAAERAVSVVVLHDRGRIVPAGAVTSAGGVRVDAETVTVDGRNACTDGGASGDGGLYGDAGEGETAPDVAGVAVPPGGFDGWRTGVAGSPPVDESRGAVPLLRASGVDSARWAELENGTLVAPDHEVPPEPWPSADAGWPLVLVSEPYTLEATHSGRGTIVATGDLAVRGGFRWDGLIIAGGGVTAEGEGLVRGGVLSGLDAHHGLAPSRSTLDGAWGFRYDACRLWNAAERVFGRLMVEPGTWSETI